MADSKNDFQQASEEARDSIVTEFIYFLSREQEVVADSDHRGSGPRWIAGVPECWIWRGTIYLRTVLIFVLAANTRRRLIEFY